MASSWACDGALVEHNIAKDCNRRANDYNAGIWPWSWQDNTVLRLNEAMWTRSTKDGQGFDSGITTSRNTTLEFNYSHDNEGGFRRSARRSRKPPARCSATRAWKRATTSAATTRRGAFIILGPVQRIRVHDNYIETGAGETVNVVQFRLEGLRQRRRIRQQHHHQQRDGALRARGEALRRTAASTSSRASVQPRMCASAATATQESTSINRWTGGQDRGAAPAVRLAGPAFDPSKPGGFTAYIQKHRAWMSRMMKEAFPARVNGPCSHDSSNAACWITLRLFDV